MSDIIDMDNMNDEEFEIAMNQAIANDTSTGDEDIVDETEQIESDVDIAVTDDSTSGVEDEIVDEIDVSTKDENNETDESDELEQLDDTSNTDSNDDDTDGKDKDNEDELDSTDRDEPDADANADEADDNTTDEQPNESEENNAKPEEQTQLRKIKADGVEYEFNQDEMDALAQKGINYTKKLQAISPWRKTISALESENMTHEDVNLMVDALKGDKDAIASMLNRAGVEALDLDTDSDVDFKPKDYGKSTYELDIEEITSSISNDKEYPITHDIISRQWDDASRGVMFDDPKLIAQLHTDVQSGMYDKVYPIAMKMKVFGDGTKSDLDYYKEAGSKVIREMNIKQATIDESNRIKAEAEARAKIDSDAKSAKIAKVKAEEKKRLDIKNSSIGRKSAATTNSVSGTKSVVDYLDMDSGASDEEFSAMMDKAIRKK